MYAFDKLGTLNYYYYYSSIRPAMTGVVIVLTTITITITIIATTTSIPVYEST
jgi:hypothetical protein